MNEDDFEKLKEYANQPRVKQAIIKDFDMRNEFENILRSFQNKHEFDDHGIFQIMKLMSHWVMFMHDKASWEEQIDKIEEALNFLETPYEKN